MKNPSLLLLLGLGVAASTASAPAARAAATITDPIQNPQPKTQTPNILLIISDDLNHWLGSLGRNPQTKTPNLDRFAKQSVNFIHANCPASVCNATRAAFMSGRRTSTIGVYGNGNLPWSAYIDETKCLNGYLKASGYHTLGAGKIYHIGGRGADPRSEGRQWDQYIVNFGHPGSAAEDDIDNTPAPRRGPRAAARDGIIRYGDIEIGKPDIPDTETEDCQIAAWGAAQLQKKYSKPFFLALGFHKPHLPFIVPKKYFDLFPLDQIQLPPHIMNDADDLPPVGKRWTNTARWKEVYGTGDPAGIKRWKETIQGYLASVAYMDAQFGLVMDALEASPHKDNTIVVFLGDHGWHLGEKQRFGKTTLWEESARAPYIWKVPGLTPPEGATCTRAVEFLSLFPTLCDLAGLPKPPYLEGASIAPLLADPKTPWTRPALTTYGYKNHSLRTENWRYIRYADGGEELYNELTDPYEWHNLAADPKYAPIKTDLAKWLPKENTPDKIRTPDGKLTDPQRAEKMQQKRKARTTD